MATKDYEALPTIQGMSLGIDNSTSMLDWTSPVTTGGVSHVHHKELDKHERYRRAMALAKSHSHTFTKTTMSEEDEDMSDDPVLRVVRVFLVDPDERIDVNKRMLHSTEEKVTDATDQELFYEIPINEILERHNEYRKSVRDKEVKDREEYLEPVRIRDLSMTVVTIAQF